MLMMAIFVGDLLYRIKPGAFIVFLSFGIFPCGNDHTAVVGVGNGNFHLTENCIGGIIGRIFPRIAGAKRQKTLAALQIVCAQRADIRRCVCDMLLTDDADAVLIIRSAYRFTEIRPTADLP